MFHNAPYGSAAMQPPHPGMATASLPTAPVVLSAPPMQAQPPQQPLLPMPSLDLSLVPVQQHGAAAEFNSFCDGLSFNSKDLITTLTRIAGENPFNADGIVAVLEQRIINMGPNNKLPFLYLVDSIVKNIGEPFIACLGRDIVNVFSHAYVGINPNVRESMKRLLNTWPALFGMDMVTQMHAKITEVDRAPRKPQQPPMPGFSAGMRSMPLHIPIGGPNLPVSAPPMMPQQRVPFGASPRQQGPSSKFLQLQSLMSQITKDASIGRPPSNHKVFNINSLISSLLQQSYLPPVEREGVQRYQQQLREISAPSRPQPSAAIARSAAPPPSRAIPLSATAALSSLLSNPPPGLLGSNPVVPVTLPARGSSQAPPLRAMPAAVPIPAVPRRPPPSTPVFQSPMPKVLKYSDIKTLSHAAAVRSLYTDLPFLSKSDGMRFKTQEQLREHLDWIFKRNRSKRAHDRGLAEGGLSRCWYESFSSFLGDAKDQGDPGDAADGGNGGTEPSTVLMGGRVGGPGGTDAEKKRIGAIPAIEASEQCAACGEELEAFWDDGQSCWMLKEATRTEDGVFHSKCMSAIADVSSEHRSASTIISPAKSEKDEPVVDKLMKLESKPVPPHHVREAETTAPPAFVGSKQESEEGTGATVKLEIKRESAIATASTQKNGSNASQAAAPEGALMANDEQTILKAGLPMHSKKRARDDDAGSGPDNSAEGLGASPEKKAKV